MRNGTFSLGEDHEARGNARILEAECTEIGSGKLLQSTDFGGVADHGFWVSEDARGAELGGWPALCRYRLVLAVRGKVSGEGRGLLAERRPIGKGEDVERNQIDERQHHQKAEPPRISRLREQQPKWNDDDGSDDEQMQGANAIAVN
jgi:hypothetical protein